MGNIQRSEVKIEDKWDLTKMIQNEQEFNTLYDKCLSLLEEIVTYQGKILQSSENLFAFLKLQEEISRLSDKLYIYAHMLFDVDSSNSTSQKLKQKSSTLEEKISSKLSFVKAELLAKDYLEVLSFVKDNASLKPYQFYLEKFYRYQGHVLGTTEEKVLFLATSAMGTGSEVFYALDNTDVKFGNITVNGHEEELTHGNYIKYISSPDRHIRKEAFDTLYKYYQEHGNSIFACLYGSIKEDTFLSKIRNYRSKLEMSLFSDNINPNVYYNLIKKVHDNLDTMSLYMQTKKDYLQLDEMQMYDIYVDLGNNLDKEIPFDEAKKLVINSLSVLGDDYLWDLNKAFTEAWIDIYPNNFKKSGAYSWGCYDSLPYLLLNYDKTIDSVSTLAHELGHSMHSYYSNHNQSYRYHDYPIFLAEIASTVNEILLNDYLYKQAKTTNEKILYLNDFLEKVRTTVFRQTMFAEFEMLIHDKIEKDLPLTLEEVNQIYYDLNKQYYGENIISTEEIKYEWMRIPHFYTSFYVYKYATGFSIALAIASRILNHDEKMLKDYLMFLKSGSSDYPLEILKKMGIDLESGEVIDLGLQMFKDKLEEMIKIIKEKK